MRNYTRRGRERCGHLELNVNTFGRDLQLAALGNLDSVHGLVAGSRLAALDLVNNVVALEDFAKDDVAAVQPGGDGSGDEELGTVGVGSGVGHRKKTLLGVLELEVLILELVAVDGLATSAVALGEVAALDHKVLDDAVERRSLVAKALLAGGKGTEVLGGLGHGLAVEPKGDATEVIVALLNVKVDLVGDLGALGGRGGPGEEDQANGEEQHGRSHEATEVEHFWWPFRQQCVMKKEKEIKQDRNRWRIGWREDT